MKKILLLTIGTLSMALGIAGIFLPLLPTTPFLLLAAACFCRSSERLYRWLIGHRILGTYIRSYREYRAVSLRAKVFAIVLLWSTIGFSAIWVVPVLIGKVLLIGIAMGVTIHLLSMRTLTKEMKEALEKASKMSSTPIVNPATPPEGQQPES